MTFRSMLSPRSWRPSRRGPQSSSRAARPARLSFALLVLFCGIVVFPVAAFAQGTRAVTVIFQGLVTSGSYTETSEPGRSEIGGGSLVGLPFTAAVSAFPQYTGSVTPTSFYGPSGNLGMGVAVWIGGQFQGTEYGYGGYLSGGSVGAGNDFSFQCCSSGLFIPAGHNSVYSTFDASGNFIGTAPYVSPFSGSSMSSPGAGSVSFSWNWATDLVADRTAGTAEITQIVVSGVPEPSTWAMLVLGVAMIGIAGRRRRQGGFLAA